MNKLFLFNMISLDGFFEGENHDINWHTVDDEFNEFAIEQLGQIGTLIFGRRTYELMASYWPTPSALQDDTTVAKAMNNLPKIVYSHTLENVEWENTTLKKEVNVDEIEKLKAESTGDIGVFGSANLAITLRKLGLIDEYRVIVSPLLLGKGTPLFQEINELTKLKLIKSRVFKNGNVLMCYEPE
jgi:dihydrofolate reductase